MKKTVTDYKAVDAKLRNYVLESEVVGELFEWSGHHKL